MPGATCVPAFLFLSQAVRPAKTPSISSAAPYSFYLAQEPRQTFESRSDRIDFAFSGRDVVQYLSIVLAGVDDETY
jgi:hypothetical protein